MFGNMMMENAYRTRVEGEGEFALLLWLSEQVFLLDRGQHLTVEAECLIINHRFIFIDRDQGICPPPTSTQRSRVHRSRRHGWHAWQWGRFGNTHGLIPQFLILTISPFRPRIGWVHLLTFPVEGLCAVSRISLFLIKQKYKNYMTECKYNYVGLWLNW